MMRLRESGDRSFGAQLLSRSEGNEGAIDAYFPFPPPCASPRLDPLYCVTALLLLFHFPLCHAASIRGVVTDATGAA